MKKKRPNQLKNQVTMKNVFFRNKKKKKSLFFLVSSLTKNLSMKKSENIKKKNDWIRKEWAFTRNPIPPNCEGNFFSSFVSLQRFESCVVCALVASIWLFFFVEKQKKTGGNDADRRAVVGRRRLQEENAAVAAFLRLLRRQRPPKKKTKKIKKKKKKKEPQDAAKGLRVPVGDGR